MKALFAITILLIAAPAFALSDDVVEVCLASSDVRACIEQGLKNHREHQRRDAEIQAAFEREIATKQAIGLALFGSGPALIAGMNQGFQNMQVKPYTIPVR